MNQKNKGFTLIELLVVVAIISLLTSVILASLSSARTKAQDAKILGELRQIQTSMEMYYNDNGRYPNGTLGTTYCLGTSCKIANVPHNTQLASSPPFTYKSSSSFLVSGNSGFLYTIPADGSTPTVWFTLNSLGIKEQEVGVWKTQNTN